jgi:hypothetical protein
MRKGLLLLLLIFLTTILHAQKDTATVMNNTSEKRYIREVTDININIYPVPVRERNFTIRCDRNISSVKVTNMIGQDIYRRQYNNPLPLTKIWLDNPKRGMYLVTVIFDDGARVVKKIMVEETE